jgi:beta-phosphoglucomutase-like phosphatase (HAD superfamily)
MDNDVDAVVLACRGTLVGWSVAIEAVAYEQARRNGESPLDRGCALARRVEALGAGDGAVPSLALGFARLAAERGWRRAQPGDDCLGRVLALARPYADVAPALELALAAGRPLVAVSVADPVLVEGTLRPLDGAFDAILTADRLGATDPAAVLGTVARQLGTTPRRLLHVSASRAGIARAAALGMRCGWVNRRAAAASPARAGGVEEWPTLRGLPEFFGMAPQTLPVAG